MTVPVPPLSKGSSPGTPPPQYVGDEGGGVKRASGGGSTKQMICKVMLLDDSVVPFQVPHKSVGKILFDQICQSLNLLETDYFGVEYLDSEGNKCWLDNEKFIINQVGISGGDVIFKFCVKFYTPDPTQLEEEYTRYLFCLQLKRDLGDGSMSCSENTTALLASYIVQADCGDYSYEDYPDHTYLSGIQFVPKQTPNLEIAIMENHKKHGGQTPAEADLNFLDIARRVEMYGIKMHPAQDHEGVGLNLAVAHMGILVYQNMTRINTFSWAKIRKLSFKRKKFLIKLHPEEYGYYKDTVEFYFHTRNQSKNFWKKCIEHHTFFRVVNNFPISAEKPIVRHKRAKLFSKGSSFRYSGRTQKEIVAFVRESFINRQPFTRSMSSHLSIKSAASPNSHIKSGAYNKMPVEGADGSGLGQSLATPAGVPYYSINAANRSETRLSKTSSTSGSHLFDTSAEDVTHGLPSRKSIDQNVTNASSLPSHPLPTQSSLDGSVSLTQNDSTAPIISEIDEPDMTDRPPVDRRKPSTTTAALNGEQAIIGNGEGGSIRNLRGVAPNNKLDTELTYGVVVVQPTSLAPSQEPPPFTKSYLLNELNGDVDVSGQYAMYDRKGSLPIQNLIRQQQQHLKQQAQYRTSKGQYVRPKSKSLTTDFAMGHEPDQDSLPGLHYKPYVTLPSLIQYDPTTFVETYAYNLPSHPPTSTSSERLLSISGHGALPSGIPKDERVEIRTSNVMVTKITEKDQDYYDSTMYHHPYREHKEQPNKVREIMRRQSEAPRSERPKQNGLVPPRRSSDQVVVNGTKNVVPPPKSETPSRYFERYDSDNLFGNITLKEGNDDTVRDKLSDLSTPSSTDTSSKSMTGGDREAETDESLSSSSLKGPDHVQVTSDENYPKGVALIRGLNKETIAAQQKKLLEEDIPYVLHVRNQHLNKPRATSAAKYAGLQPPTPLSQSQRQSSAESFGYYDTAYEERRGKTAVDNRVSSAGDIWHPQTYDDFALPSYQTAYSSVQASPCHHNVSPYVQRHDGRPATVNGKLPHIDKASSISDLPYRMSVVSPVKLDRHRASTASFGKEVTGASLSLSHIPTSAIQTATGLPSTGMAHKPYSPTTPQPLRRHRTDEEIRAFLKRSAHKPFGSQHYQSVHGHDHVLQHLPHFTFDLVRLNKLPSKTSFSSLDHTLDPFPIIPIPLPPPSHTTIIDGALSTPPDDQEQTLDADESLILAALARSETNVASAAANEYGATSGWSEEPRSRKNLRRSISNPSRGCPLGSAPSCYHASDYYYPPKASASTTQLKPGGAPSSTPFVFIDDDNNYHALPSFPFTAASQHGYCRKDWFQKEPYTAPKLPNEPSGEGQRRKKSRHRKTRSRSRSSQQKALGIPYSNSTSPSASSSSSTTKHEHHEGSGPKRHNTPKGLGYVPPPRPVHSKDISPSSLVLSPTDTPRGSDPDRDVSPFIYEGLELPGNVEADNKLPSSTQQLGPSDYNSVTEAEGYSDITIY